MNFLIRVKMSHGRDILSEIHNYGIDIRNREIFLHSSKDGGDDDPGVDYRMSINFVKNLRHMDSINKNPIRINMQSIGGDWFAGWSIFDAIKSSESYVTIVTYGQAESMSSIILQAADERLMMPNAHFMCHFGHSSAVSDVLSNQNWAQAEKKYINIMINTYAEKCHSTGSFFKAKGYSLSQTKAYIKRKMKDGDWYMSSEEAVNYGFADGIVQ